MSTWVEENVGADVRVLGQLMEKPRRGRPALTYWVAAPHHPDTGPFETFDAALETARRLAGNDTE